MPIIFYRTDFSASGLEMSWKALCDMNGLDPEETEYIEVAVIYQKSSPEVGICP